MDDHFFDKLNKSHYEGKTKDEQDKLELQRQQKAAEALRAYFSEILERNSSRQINVKSVTVTGGGGRATRAEFLDKQLQPVFHAKSLSGLVKAIDQVYGNLAGLGIYETINFQLNDDVVAEHRPFSGLFNTGKSDQSKINLNAILRLTQAKRFTAKTGADLGNSEGNGYINFSFKNLFGGAEILSLDATMGNRTRSSYIANFNTPLLWVLPPQWRFETLAYMTSRSIPWASNEQIIRGVSAKIKALNKQELGLEAVWRTIACNSGASQSVREEAGNSLKASIFHSWIHDSRDHHLMPTKGSYFKISQELAGICNVGNPFYKASFETQNAWSFGKTSASTITLGTRAGALWMLTRPSSNSTSPPPSNIMDRFFLGGPNDVRGFYTSGIGPRDSSDSLGGEAFLASGISVLTPFPRINPDTPLKLHGFINAGSLLPLDRQSISDTNDNVLVNTFSQLVRTPSIAAGVGVLYCHPVARFELNFSLPIVAREYEGTRKGLQFGVGLSFL